MRANAPEGGSPCHAWNVPCASLIARPPMAVFDFSYHSAIEDSGTTALTAGQSYSLRMEYYDATETATARLSWRSLSQKKEIVPASHLLPAP